MWSKQVVLFQKVHSQLQVAGRRVASDFLTTEPFASEELGSELALGQWVHETVRIPMGHRYRGQIHNMVLLLLILCPAYLQPD